MDRWKMMFLFKLGNFQVEMKDSKKAEFVKLTCSRKGAENKTHHRFLFEQDPLKASNNTSCFFLMFLVLVWAKAKNQVKTVDDLERPPCPK